MATINDYFKRVPKPSEVVPRVASDSFTQREKDEVTKQLSESEGSKKRGKYKTWNLTEKLEIGGYAIQHGNGAALRHFSSQYQGFTKQSVSDFKKVCAT